MLGDISAEALFAMTGEQIAVHIARSPVNARRLDYLKHSLFAGKFDTNPRYHRPAPSCFFGRLRCPPIFQRPVQDPGW